MNTANSQTYINIPHDGSVFSLLKTYLDINLDVLHAATGNRYADGNDIRIFKFNPIALSSSYKLTSSSGKHLEHFSHAHIVFCFFYCIN